MKIQESFTDEFKSLWEPHSTPRLIWDVLEALYTVLEQATAKQIIKLAAYRDFNEIERDMKASIRPMEQLYVELVNIFWNRLVLRTQLKVRDSLQLVFYGANANNIYGYALAARSIVEHVALVQYLVNAVPWRTNREVPKEQVITFTTQLYNLVFGSTFDWDKMLRDSGAAREMLSSGKWKRPPNQRIPKIADLVQSLDEELYKQNRLAEKDQIKFLYSQLCDVVHPSWGGEFVYSPRMRGAPTGMQELGDDSKLAAVLFLFPVVELVRHLIELSEGLEKDELKAVLAP